MNHPWSAVSLSEVLKHRKEFITIDDFQKYKRCRIQLHAKGIILRDLIEGARIKTKEQQVCRAGEFLVAEIDAKVGGFGIVPEDLEGAIVSSHYFLFEIDQEKLDKGFLDYYIRTPTFQDQISARGTTNYAAIRPHHVLEYSIPFPALPEQLRIVAKIEALAAKIREANALREHAIADCESIFISTMNGIWKRCKLWNHKPMSELVTTVVGQVNPQLEPYSSLPHINGESIQSGTCRLLHNYRLAKEDGVTSGKYYFKGGSILYSKIRPYLRKSVQVPFDGICSADIYAFDKISNDIEPRFLMYGLIAPDFTDYANMLSGRTRMPKLNQHQLYAYNFAFPKLSEQRQIVAYLDGLQAQVDALKKLQAQTAAELDALLPAILDRAFKGGL
jgi:type I restriction enzyme, S subunit